MREYNAERPSCERSAQQLRNCWKKLKQQTRKNLANDKVFVYVCANDLILLFIFFVSLSSTVICYLCGWCNGVTDKCGDLCQCYWNNALTFLGLDLSLLVLSLIINCVCRKTCSRLVEVHLSPLMWLNSTCWSSIHSVHSLNPWSMTLMTMRSNNTSASSQWMTR